MPTKPYRTIECRCRYCGAKADMITRIQDISKIPEKDRRFTCNQCMIDYFSQQGTRQQLLFPPKVRF